MLDSSILSQLEGVFARLEATVVLAYDQSDHPKQPELEAMLKAVAQTSPMVEAQESGKRGDVPHFTVEGAHGQSGISFRGIPGGHEFTSLVLAILNADGKGKQPDPALIERIRRIEGPVRVRTFVSLSCENCPDVVQALNLLATLHDDFEHEMIDGEYALEEVDRLRIQGVPAVMAGDTLLSSGKATVLDLIERLAVHFGEAAAEPRDVDLGHYDVVVVGAGPAGVSSAIYTARKGLKTAVITDRLGGQLQETKGIENMISVVYTEGPQLAANLHEHMKRYDVELLEHRRVKHVERGKTIEVSLEGGEHLTTGALVVATGAKWRELGVDGEKEYLGRGVAFCPHCDGPFYKGKDIAVVGGGNSGVEAAIDLAGIVKHVTVVEFMDELKADAVLEKKLRSLPNVSVITGARTSRIIGNGEKVTALEYVDRASDTPHQVDLAGVFVQIGLVPNSRFVADVVETNRYGEIIIDEKCRTSAPGIYAAGDVTTVPYKQIVIALGEGAKAGLAAFEDQMVA